MENLKDIRVLIVDSDSQRCSKRMTELAKTREFNGIRSCLPSELEYTLEQNTRFDICLLSISDLPLQSIQAVIRSYQETDSPGKVILTDAGDDPKQLIRYLEAGAWDYVHSWETHTQIVEKAKDAIRNRVELSPKMAGAVVSRLQDLSRMRPQKISLSNGYSDLTPREREVLTLIGKRMSNREIAEALVLEIGTVKNHVHNLLKKLDVDNRYEAAAYSPYHSTNGHNLKV